MNRKRPKTPAVASGVPQHHTKLKQPRTAAELPAREKLPRSLNVDHEQVLRRQPVWRFSDLDAEWPPGAAKLTVADFRKLHGTLGGYETQTLAEIWSSVNNGCHAYAVPNLPEDALNRLTELTRDDEDALHSLRLTSSYRVIGVLREHIFYVLWIDPDHEVWP